MVVIKLTEYTNENTGKIPYIFIRLSFENNRTHQIELYDTLN